MQCIQATLHCVAVVQTRVKTYHAEPCRVVEKSPSVHKIWWCPDFRGKPSHTPVLLIVPERPLRDLSPTRSLQGPKRRVCT
jgi:hypothetical protein